MVDSLQSLGRRSTSKDKGKRRALADRQENEARHQPKRLARQRTELAKSDVSERENAARYPSRSTRQQPDRKGRKQPRDDDDEDDEDDEEKTGSDLSADDDDDDDDEEDGAQAAAAAVSSATQQQQQQRNRNTNGESQNPPSAKKRKIVRQEDKTEEGATWCAFDATVVAKSHLQLMNLRPRTLGHARIVLSRLPAASTGRAEAESALADVWSDLGPKPGYWLVPLLAGDLDDAWWKVLAPHVNRRCFGDVLIFQTIPATASSAASLPPPESDDSARAALSRATHRLPRFDDLEERNSTHRRLGGGGLGGLLQQQQQQQHQQQASARAASNAACLVVLASGTLPELRRVGEYLAALFPTKPPLYFRRLKGTAAGASKKVAFANDPRADPDCLSPSWHSKHADLRVNKTAQPAFSAAAPRPLTFALEAKGPANDWRPYEETAASSSSSSSEVAGDDSNDNPNNNNNKAEEPSSSSSAAAATSSA